MITVGRRRLSPHWGTPPAAARRRPRLAARLAAGAGNPLPLQLHAYLPEAATLGRRVLVVGDIHGGGAAQGAAHASLFQPCGPARWARSAPPSPHPRASPPLHAVPACCAAAGCYEELLDLLDKCSYAPGEDVLVLVGDLVNKGPRSAEVRRYGAGHCWPRVGAGWGLAALAGCIAVAGAQAALCQRSGLLTGQPRPLHLQPPTGYPHTHRRRHTHVPAVLPAPAGAAVCA